MRLTPGLPLISRHVPVAHAGVPPTLHSGRQVRNPPPAFTQLLPGAHWLLKSHDSPSRRVPLPAHTGPDEDG